MILTRYLQKLAILIVIASSYVSANSEIVGGTVTPFFDALMRGDVVTVENFLGDPLLNDVKVLLRDNKGYPDYLRVHYSGTSVVVTRIESNSDTTATVSVDVNFPAGHVESLQLDLIRNSEGYWKIHQQITIQK